MKIINDRLTACKVKIIEYGAANVRLEYPTEAILVIIPAVLRVGKEIFSQRNVRTCITIYTKALFPCPLTCSLSGSCDLLQICLNSLYTIIIVLCFSIDKYYITFDLSNSYHTIKATIMHIITLHYTLEVEQTIWLTTGIRYNSMRLICTS